MGGMQTINIGFPNADKFHYLMPSSSAPGIQGQSQLFPNGGALAMANLKLIFFTCGSGEVNSYGCMNNNTVRGYAQSNGLGNIIEEFIVQGGAHNAETWRPSFWNFAQLADQAGFTQVGTTRSSGCMGGGTGGTRRRRSRQARPAAAAEPAVAAAPAAWLAGAAPAGSAVELGRPRRQPAAPSGGTTGSGTGVARYDGQRNRRRGYDGAGVEPASRVRRAAEPASRVRWARKRAARRLERAAERDRRCG